MIVALQCFRSLRTKRSKPLNGSCYEYITRHKVYSLGNTICYEWISIHSNLYKGLVIIFDVGKIWSNKICTMEDTGCRSFSPGVNKVTTRVERVTTIAGSHDESEYT